jgi:hypothetical protein
LCGFYEFGTSRLAIRDQPPPSKPIIPMTKFIIRVKIPLYKELR